MSVTNSKSGDAPDASVDFKEPKESAFDLPDQFLP